MNKPKTLISLAILPVMALAGCDGYKTKVAPSSKNTTKNANGAYQKCDPNDPKTDCNGSSGGGSGGVYAGSGSSDLDSKHKSGKSSGSKGGFGSSAGHSGG